MIKLTDFITTPDMSKTKIKFNMNPNNPEFKAWDYLLDEDPEWYIMNAFRTKQSNNNLGEAMYLISLAQYYPYGPQYFVFGGIYKVEKIEPEIINGVGYKLTLLEDYIEYRKRLIIKIDKTIGRDLYTRLYKNVQEQLNPIVYEITPDVKLGHFPGYQNVRLKHVDMARILNLGEPSWKSALSYVKGIYVITDLSNGKLYIGSASGNTDGIWQRWSGYAHEANLTGGNKYFIETISRLGAEHIKQNFQYSILEIFDTKTKQETIIEREAYWKKVFATQTFGMNHN